MGTAPGFQAALMPKVRTVYTRTCNYLPPICTVPVGDGAHFAFTHPVHGTVALLERAGDRLLLGAPHILASGGWGDPSPGTPLESSTHIHFGKARKDKKQLLGF